MLSLLNSVITLSTQKLLKETLASLPSMLRTWFSLVWRRTSPLLSDLENSSSANTAKRQLCPKSSLKLSRATCLKTSRVTRMQRSTQGQLTALRSTTSSAKRKQPVAKNQCLWLWMIHTGWSSMRTTTSAKTTGGCQVHWLGTTSLTELSEKRWTYSALRRTCKRRRCELSSFK